MLFHSAAFLLFLPATAIVYWAIPTYWRIHFLVAASYLFYASWSVPYAALMFGLVLINWSVATAAIRWVECRTLLVAGGIALDLSVLALFKYMGFLERSIDRALVWVGAPTVGLDAPNLVLPLGISFFTFEFIHYLADVRSGNMPSSTFSQFHIFAAFFPTQIAGPIKRFQDFLPQLKVHRKFDLELAHEALSLIIRGLFKKRVLADNLAPLVSSSFANPGGASFAEAWAATLAFAFQIYFDFSGYTDIARGAALLFGFRLPLNFMHPYLANNVSNFWDRWHISLSRWLRDYVYIPLGGSRKQKLIVARNLAITMLLGGLWHGAAWHFVVWGGYWAVLLAGYHQWRALGYPCPATIRGFTRMPALQVASTFLLTLIGWTFFRGSLTGAGRLLAVLFWPVHSGSLVNAHLIVMCAFTAAYFGWAMLSDRAMPPVVRWAPVRGVAYATLLMVAVVGAPTGYQPFIYFQF